MKKRIAAMVLAGAMALSLAPAYGATEVKAEASDMKIAMVTDSGDITDQSFNQTTSGCTCDGIHELRTGWI